jgi:hypothetical protein
MNRWLFLILLVAVARFPSHATAEDSMTPAEFTAVRKAVLPKEGEDNFETIPWLTSIWEARIKAAKEGKPILLWEMDGHPLGCG